MKKFFILLLFFTYAHSSVSVITVSKCGTRMLAKVLRMYNQIGDGQINFLMSHPHHFSFQFRNTHRYDEKRLLEHINCGRKIILVRDFRDSVISMVYFIDKLIDNGAQSKTFNHVKVRKYNWENIDVSWANDWHNYSMKEKILHVIRGDLKGFLPEFLLFDAHAILPFIKSSDVLLVRFEELVGENGGGSAVVQRDTIRKIISHCEVPCSEQVLDHISTNIWGNTGTFRKGVIGNWKEYFDQEIKNAFKKYFGESLIFLGYEKDYNW